MITRLRLSRTISLLASALFFSNVHAAIAQSASPSFEVASVRSVPQGDPSTGSWSPPRGTRFTANHVSLTRLILLAYGVDSSQIANKPSWLDSNLYDVDAKAEDGVELTRDALKPRLQNLLRDRFHLVAHAETRSIRGYALVIGKNGHHLTSTKADHFPGYRVHVGAGEMRGVNWSLPQFAQYLSTAAGFPVVDETSITGSYDIGFSYNPNPDDQHSDLPLLSSAREKATGLQMKEQKVPLEVIVIDSLNKEPTDN